MEAVRKDNSEHHTRRCENLKSHEPSMYLHQTKCQL